MIISASRRTDIPAFYSDWFFRRLREGYLLVKNPMNRMQVSRINLTPDTVSCIVFWTKNPQPMLNRINQLKDYTFYFHFTITAFGHLIEKQLPDRDIIIDTFKRLSDQIGPERVIWRYDPVFYIDKYDYSFHTRYFEYLAKSLEGFTERCMYSFLTVYKKCGKNMKGFEFQRPAIDDMFALSHQFSSAASAHGIKLQTCAENSDFSDHGIIKGKCIDDELISRISGKKLTIPKDSNQRDACLCSSSIDIGAYNTCVHRCIYCYANYDHNLAAENYREHKPGAELITGTLAGDEKIYERIDRHKNPGQINMFD